MEQNKRPLDEDAEEEEPSNKRLRTERIEVGLLLFNRAVGQVIGKGGENINSIRSVSGARVNINKLIPNAFERIAEVSGDVEEVSKAIQMIATSISEDDPSITILAESRNLGPVIGKGGATITQIRADTQAKVHIGKECLGGSSQKEIRISGGSEAVLPAIDTVLKYLAEGKSHVRMPYIPQGGGNFGSPMRGGNFGSPRRGGNFGPPMRGRGRGRGGYNMMPMYGGSGMQYQDSHQGGNRPPPSGLHIETNIRVPKRMIGFIIGRGGRHINTVRQKSGATIVLEQGDDDEPDRKITITGERESMDIACSMIENLASQQ